AVATGRSRSCGQTSTVSPPSTFHATHATSGAPSAFMTSSRLQSGSKVTSRSCLPKIAGTIETQYPCTIPRPSRRRIRSRTAGADKDTLRPSAWKLCRASPSSATRRRKSFASRDGRNLDDIRRAVAGQDAVISIVSSEGRGPTTVMSEVTRVELDAMREAGVRRLVSVSVSAIEGRRPWILINLVRWILRKPYADFARMERLIALSSVDWTIVRPPYLSNGPKTGWVRTRSGRSDLRHGPYHISRADLAATLVDLAEDSQHVGEVL